MVAELRGLSGKKILVTGAAKGQGLSHVLAFADAGCDIAALDITDPVEGMYALATPEMLEATIRAVEDRGRRCIGLPCDLRDENQVRSSVEKALDFFGGHIDVVVNNAGVATSGAIQDVTREEIDTVIDTNVKGHMYVAKYVVPSMIRERKGKIINISSATTGFGIAQLSPYVASKYAINGLTKAWATELAEFGICVNAIAPTTIRPGEGQGSGMLLGLAPDFGLGSEELYETLSATYNLPGDMWRGESRHITDAVLFLASDNAELITGQILAVDGGMTTR